MVLVLLGQLLPTGHVRVESLATDNARAGMPMHAPDAAAAAAAATATTAAAFHLAALVVHVCALTMKLVHALFFLARGDAPVKRIIAHDVRMRADPTAARTCLASQTMQVGVFVVKVPLALRRFAMLYGVIQSAGADDNGVAAVADTPGLLLLRRTVVEEVRVRNMHALLVKCGAARDGGCLRSVGLPLMCHHARAGLQRGVQRAQQAPHTDHNLMLNNCDRRVMGLSLARPFVGQVLREK